MPSNACTIPSTLLLSVSAGISLSLSLRDLEEMMAERGINVDHSTLHRWVIRLVPLLDKAFRRHKRHPGRRWRMDETYIKIRGQWKGSVALRSHQVTCCFFSMLPAYVSDPKIL